MRIADTRAYASSPGVLARNTLFNFVGQAVVAVAAILLLPVIVRGLGHEAYGLLSLALVISSTFGILDLGLGRTTTKFVAEALAKGDTDQVTSAVWTSTAVQAGIGVAAGLVLVVISPFLTQRVLRISLGLQADARLMLIILALTMPITLASFSLRGALEGTQRFDLVNLIKVSLNLSTYIAPFVGALAGWRVPMIVLVMAVARLVAALAYLSGCVYTLPALWRLPSPANRASQAALVSYAGWVAVSSFIVPLLVQINQYLIGALASVEAVTFYSVPYEMLNGLWIIPGALVATLFPAYSSLDRADEARIIEVYRRPLKYIILALGPLIAVMVVFAKDILMLWQGAIFAERSTLVLQTLVIGVLINSLEWVPANLVMGLGRPDLVAKSHLVQLPIYLVLAYRLINRWGVVGGALAFALRVCLEAVLVFAAAGWLAPVTRRALRDRQITISTAWLGVLSCGVLLIHVFSDSLSLQLGLVSGLLVLFVGLAWTWVLDDRDRSIALSLVTGLKRAMP